MVTHANYRLLSTANKFSIFFYTQNTTMEYFNIDITVKKNICEPIS